MRHIKPNAEWASRQPFTKGKEAKSMASELFESMTMMEVAHCKLNLVLHESKRSRESFVLPVSPKTWNDVFMVNQTRL